MLAIPKLSLEQTEDFETLNKIINDPSIAISKELNIPKDYDVNWINDASGGIIWILARIDNKPVGFFWFDPYEGDYLSHVMMLPEGRGIMAVKFIDAVCTWMFMNTKCKMLWAKPPFLKSYILVKRCGFEDVCISYEKCDFSEKVWKRRVTVLTRKRWEDILHGTVTI